MLSAFDSRHYLTSPLEPVAHCPSCYPIGTLLRVTPIDDPRVDCLRTVSTVWVGFE